MDASKEAYVFNCAQRIYLLLGCYSRRINSFLTIAGAHQNTLENLPIIYVLSVAQFVLSFDTDGHFSTLLVGTKYPIVAASACALWSISRISYTCGYIKGNASKARTIFTLFPTVN